MGPGLLPGSRNQEQGQGLVGFDTQPQCGYGDGSGELLPPGGTGTGTGYERSKGED